MTVLARITEQLDKANIGELDAEIERCLQYLGLELELTIASLVERVDDRLVTRVQWRANGYMDPAFELDLHAASWWYDHIREDEDIIIDVTTDLPDSADHEREYLQVRSTASLVAMPAGWKTGQFLVAEVLWTSRSWSAEALEILADASRELGVALTRHAEKRRLVEDAVKAAADSEAKNEFIATLAHELRTPLTAILGYAQLLSGGVAGPLEGKQKQFVDDILSCAEHLERIVEETLALAKLDSQRMILKLAEVDVRAMVQTAILAVQSEAGKSGLDIDIKLPPKPTVITADELKIRQVLINLMSNAIKFTPKGAISIAVTPSDNHVAIAVSDTGVGIAPANLERIFETFARVQRGEADGTGLGLALVKRLVELHEGRVEVTSEVGVGSCFTVVLPRKPIAAISGRPAYVRSVV